MSSLGAGGMGEVYRAQDTKLNRQVAIKVLPPEYAADPDRIARFEREAQAVAALNHPGIAAIYEFNQSDQVRYLVLELVEGETLADTLQHGAMNVERALRISRNICDALEAAHDKGICHRDLKPANIKTAPDGTVKILDFGLAKILENSPAKSGLTNSPTLSLAATYPGVILGTAAYMSPEQAKGFPADHRSDIFSLGCILYELLTARQAFEGETASEILASVLKTEPDFARLPPRLNPRIIELLRRCLEKNPKNRWHSIADVRVELDGVLARGAFTDEISVGRRPVWKRALPLLAAAVVGAALATLTLWTLWRGVPPPSSGVTRFVVSLPEGQVLATTNRTVIAWSPDGKQLAYAATDRLYLRDMSDPQPRSIAGTEGALGGVAFSPDGRSLAFWSTADRTIKRIATTGGASITIAPAAIPPIGLSWTDSGLIYIMPNEGVLRVASSGGAREVLVKPSADDLLSAPQLLPDGKSVLFSIATGTGTNRWDSGQIVVQAIGSSERKTLITGGSEAHYAPTGHIVYAVGGILMAVPFDANRLEVRGAAVPILEGVRRAPLMPDSVQPASFSFSPSGSLAYIAGPISASNEQADLALIDRHGTTQPLRLPSMAYQAPRVAPNGRFVAVGTDEGEEAVIWVYELAGTTALRQLTFRGKNRFPVWSSDSIWVAFQSDREGDFGIFRQRADGSGAVERLTKPEDGTSHVPYAWSPNGEVLLYDVHKDQRHALWSLSLRDRRAAPIADVESAVQSEAVFSPDGRWIAYQVGRTIGDSEIYLQPLSGGAKYSLPPEVRNHHPLWSPTGELFYIPRQGLTFAIAVNVGPPFSLGRPTPIQRGPRVEGPPNIRRNHDLTPDGKHFVGVIPASAESSLPRANVSEIPIVLNWLEELKQRVPTR